MKRLLLVAAIAVLSVSACKNNQNNPESTKVDSTNTETLQNSPKTEYTCPMHPDVISDKAGQCPQCGMDLQAKS
ncbi:MAG: hypothetical protein IPP51_01205 [Bacteroidetes bacterium]|nr:hypothetical protein [Bacteroidota bacterium]